MRPNVCNTLVPFCPNPSQPFTPSLPTFTGRVKGERLFCVFPQIKKPEEWFGTSLSYYNPQARWLHKVVLNFQHQMPSQEPVQFRFLRSIICQAEDKLLFGGQQITNSTALFVSYVRSALSKQAFVSNGFSRISNICRG